MTVSVKNYTCEIHRYLFPVPKEDSKRVITFANHDDFISYRHHTYKKGEAGKGIELKEVGPRFQLRRKLFLVSCIHISRLTVLFLVYDLKLGTIDQADAADTEWAYRPYMNTTKKRRFLSDDDGWKA